MTGLLNALGFGLITAAIIGISSVALSLQYGVTNFANFAHGEFLTIGAYSAYAAQHFTNNLLLEVLAGATVSALFAMLMNIVTIQPFVRRGVKLGILLVVTAAVSQIAQGVISFSFGLDNVVLRRPADLSHKHGPFVWTTLDIQTGIAAVIVVAALFGVLRMTSFGRAQRAVADDPMLARVTGINTKRIVTLTWLITGALAGGAGVALAATVGSFNNQLGFNFLLVTFAAAIIGGIGKVNGAIVGALIIGIVTEVTGYYFNAGYKQEFALIALVLFLFVRPRGIFGPVREAV
ncbi:MAG: branched-chain amino acid transport system permease protein [Pseudonocardiales bacterium]|jgi:branched-subunit amino acid ABC-type transport system permease component|nr:branched-chain amino acid transport system permease protein [Pseudonocardiales bacterium]